MAFVFSAEQRQQLVTAISAASTAFNNDNVGTGLFTDVYNLLRSFIGTTSVAAAGVDEAVWTWIGGAQDVNEENGGFADFIRDYTSFQYELRYGVPLTEAELQGASNQVSQNFFQDLLLNFGGTADQWTLPTLPEIGGLDTGAAAANVFFGDVSPWSGNLLFPFSAMTVSFGRT